MPELSEMLDRDTILKLAGWSTIGSPVTDVEVAE